MEQKERLMKKFSSGRSNLLAMTILTLVNIVLIAVKAEFGFTFSAFVPQILAAFGTEIYTETSLSVYIIAGVGLAVFSTAIYFLCYVKSKKNGGWIVASLVLFILDTAALLLYCLLFFEISYLIDVAFHAWVLYYLISGTSAYFNLKKIVAMESAYQQGYGFPYDPNLNPDNQALNYGDPGYQPLNDSNTRNQSETEQY